MASDHRSRLIVNADDFGRSATINLAVIKAHREGILTTASLMVNEPAAEEAIQMARENPNLGVGLHLALCCGRAALSQEEIPHLACTHGNFSDNPVTTGVKLYFSPRAKEELKIELDEQFRRFHATGLVMDHVNGHLNIHLHPVVIRMLMENAERWKIRAMRLTRDPFRFNSRLAKGAWLYKIFHSVIYHLLSCRALSQLESNGIKHTRFVFGLLQNAQVDEKYLEALIRALPPGDHEVYSHPSLDKFKNEFEALISPKMKNILQEKNVRLIRYQDL
ncbi:MAG: cellobiose phosphotransferase system YdjC-like protein [Verrucomicrobiales bacterium]|nr:cellobiose phosphotransferase system YdjC-like protein [Verrucomicrobiales bacterium]